MLPVPGHIQAEPLVGAALVAGADRHGHVHTAAVDAAQTGLPVDEHVVIIDLHAAVVLQFPHGVLVEAAVADAKFPRKGHLAHEGQLLLLAGGSLPVLHPGDHHPTPVLRKERLRRIEVQAVVDGLHPLAHQMIALAIEVHDQADV